MDRIKDGDRWGTREKRCASSFTYIRNKTPLDRPILNMNWNQYVNALDSHIPLQALMKTVNLFKPT